MIATLAGAAAVTAGLFALMSALIAEEFVPQDKTDFGEMQIQPRVEEAALAERRLSPEPLEPIDVPPAPPRVEVAKTPLPSEPVANPLIPPNPFDPVRIGPQDFQVTLSDREPQPLVRIPPTMPARATRSGHCKVALDVTATGEVVNARALGCSQAMFERPTLRAVGKWRYQPKIVDGRGVMRRNVRATVTFALRDERGEVIPE